MCCLDEGSDQRDVRRGQCRPPYLGALLDFTVSLELGHGCLCSGVSRIFGVCVCLIMLRWTTAAAAVNLTAALSSVIYRSTAGKAEGSPRFARASSAAACTIQLLSPVASTSALVVAGSGSRASTLAAAARTGEESSFRIALIAPHPMPAKGTKPMPSSNPNSAIFFGSRRRDV